MYVAAEGRESKKGVHTNTVLGAEQPKIWPRITAGVGR